jgi:ribosomal protein S18 acetylase RimI-like enzyme
MDSDAPMDLRYEVNPGPASLKAEVILMLLEQAGIADSRWSADRMDRALQNSSVVVCAWDAHQFVGFARVITDFAWFAYLSQLAVRPAYQNRGIGKQLVACVRREIGDEVGLLVHSAESAARFYRSAGFEPYANFYRIPRRK